MPTLCLCFSSSLLPGGCTSSQLEKVKSKFYHSFLYCIPLCSVNFPFLCVDSSPSFMIFSPFINYSSFFNFCPPSLVSIHLKVQGHEFFDSRFFSWIIFHQILKSLQQHHFNFFQTFTKYSQLKVHCWCLRKSNTKFLLVSLKTLTNFKIPFRNPL